MAVGRAVKRYLMTTYQPTRRTATKSVGTSADVDVDAVAVTADEHEHAPRERRRTRERTDHGVCNRRSSSGLQQPPRGA